MDQIINLLFKKVKEIRSKEGVLHFVRWEVFSLPKTNIHLYIHKIAKADEDHDQHDHPWSFFSLVLKGGYAEKVGKKFIHRNRFSIAHRNAEETHKVLHLDKFETVYTLVLTHGKPRIWGYKTNKGWMDFESYRKNKHPQ